MTSDTEQRGSTMRFEWRLRDPSDAVIVHEALMSYRNRECTMPADFLRAEAGDRLLADLDYQIVKLAALRRSESEKAAGEP